MEPPQKRPRLSLGYETETEPDDRDLQEARAQNDLRLKSIFEGIFEKYGRDFTDVGDEIDLQTGKIVVDNGHLHGMLGEDDTGEKDWMFQEEEVRQISDITLEGPTHDSGTWTETGGDKPHKEVSPFPAFGFDRSYCEEPPPHETDGADSDGDDDKNSVDSLLDTALCIENESDGLPGNWGLTLADKSEAVAAKANTTAEPSTKSQPRRGDTLGEPVESIWRVPEISGKFSTPTLKKSRQRLPLSVVQSASPPGAGSLWALPGRSRRNTDGKKEKEKSRKKLGASPRKHKHYSSPVLHDWSFAETPDGNESDDPLQEDYQRSPTPKHTINIRGKKKNVQATPNTKDEPPQQSHGPQSSSDAPHKVTETRPDESATQEQPKISSKDAQDEPPVGTPTVGAEPSANSVTAQTPTPTRAKRAPMTPDEAKLIVRMRQIQGKKWKEVLDHFPQRKLIQLIQWNQVHWNERQDKPPRLSRPWSPPELDRLRSLSNQQGLTWPEIRAAFPGRSHAEIEFELLRLCAGVGEGPTAKTAAFVNGNKPTASGKENLLDHTPPT